MKTAEQVLREAADILRFSGWIRGESYDDRGRHCMLGALELTNGANCYDAIAALKRVTGIAVADFNDDHCKTAADAIAALEIAADLAAP